MYKIVVIPDVHGRSTWKQLVSHEAGADKYVFLGDYFDSPDISANQQCKNFTDIVSFKRDNLANAELLVGNHDLSYYMRKYLGYSGYQPQAAKLIEPLVSDAKQYLNICYKHKNILFTHAGVSEQWLSDVFGRTYINLATKPAREISRQNIQTIEKDLNNLLHKMPGIYDFSGTNPYGDSPTQTPVWIRPGSLMHSSKQLKDYFNIIQVVGHTRFKSLTLQNHFTEDKYYFTDTLHEESGEYLVIEDDKFIIKTL